MLFSIITVSFNSAKTIRQTFDSVLQQEFKDYEYIVVDGASTDGTVDIIKEYEPKFEGRMRWSSEPDKGIYDAMNKGITLSSGKYLNFLNSDDFYEKNTLSLIESHLEERRGEVYYGITRLLGSENTCWLERKCHSLPREQGALNHQAVFYRRSIFYKYGFYDTDYEVCADFDLQCRLLKAGVVFSPVDHIVVNYSCSGFSVSSANIEKSILEVRQILLKNDLLSLTEYKRIQRDELWISIGKSLRQFLLRLFF